MPVKNASSASNARARKVGTVAALARVLRNRGALDQRFTLSKVINAHVAEYRAHAGGDAATVPMLDVCEHAACNKALARIAFADLMENGLFNEDGTVRAAFEVWRRASGDLLAALRLLGLDRRERDALTLAELLDGDDRE